jgi:hypothetical protein
MRCPISSPRSWASHAVAYRMKCAFCARATSPLDNRQRERLLVKVRRLLRPGVPLGLSRREVFAGSSAATGEN